MKITKGYIQGAFDGEGCLGHSFGKHGEYWQIQITNTDPVWLESIAKYLKDQGYHPTVHAFQRPNKPLWKPKYVLLLGRRAEIKHFLQEFPPLMASRQKKAAEFFLWDRQHRPRMFKGSNSVIQQAMDILEDSRDQGRLL